MDNDLSRLLKAQTSWLWTSLTRLGSLPGIKVALPGPAAPGEYQPPGGGQRCLSAARGVLGVGRGSDGNGGAGRGERGVGGYGSVRRRLRRTIYMTASLPRPPPPTTRSTDPFCVSFTSSNSCIGEKPLYTQVSSLQKYLAYEKMPHPPGLL